MKAALNAESSTDNVYVVFDGYTCMTVVETVFNCDLRICVDV